MSTDLPDTQRPILPEQPLPPPPPDARPFLPEQPLPPPPPDRCPDEDADLEAETEVDAPTRPSVPTPARSPDRHDAIITNRTSLPGGWSSSGPFGSCAITG